MTKKFAIAKLTVLKNPMEVIRDVTSVDPEMSARRVRIDAEGEEGLRHAVVEGRSHPVQPARVQRQSASVASAVTFGLEPGFLPDREFQVTRRAWHLRVV